MSNQLRADAPADLPTEPTGSSLQVLADLAWKRDAGRSELYFEGVRWTSDQLADRTRRLSGGLHAPEETAKALRGGYLHTGDVGRLDADGYLYIVDRIKDLIIRGGYNVYPRDVENVLVQHPDVVSAAVVGKPDEKYGEEVVAFVQLVPGSAATPGGLVAFARQHLSAVKYPREVRVVDAVPLTSVLKTDRKRLRAQLTAEASQA